jgi:MFS family permease
VLYFADVTGSFAAAGLVMAVLLMSSVVLEVPTGVVSDWVGRKGTLVAGALAMLGAVCAYAAADGLAALLLGACLEGLSQALFSGNNDALLMDTLTEVGREGEFAEMTGRIRSAQQAGAALTAGLGGVIAAVTALMQREFSPAHRATMGSVGALGVSLATAVIALGVGLLADRLGIITALLLTQAGQFASMFFFRAAFKPSAGDGGRLNE